MQSTYIGEMYHQLIDGRMRVLIHKIGKEVGTTGDGCTTGTMPAQFQLQFKSRVTVGKDIGAVVARVRA
jgi:hypothetical protein